MRFSLLPIALFALLFTSSVIAADTKVAKGFLTNDIFHTAAFLENRDMIDNYKQESIRFMINHDNITAYFTDKGLIYRMSKIEEDSKEEKGEKKKEEKTEEEDERIVATSYIFMNWVGANPHPKIISSEKLKGYYTFMKDSGNTYKSLVTNGYKKIVYQDLYPGIDVEYTVPEKGGMEYALLVHPGADVAQVKMVYSGAVKNITKDANGDLTIHSGNGDLIEHAPKTFTLNKEAVSSTFNLSGKTIHFEFPNGYDHSKDLVIDPWVTAITNLPYSNIGFDVDYDLQGNLFVFGAGGSFSDPSTFSMIAKYDTSGNPLWTFVCSLPAQSWSSYLSGSGNWASNFLVDKTNGKTYVGKGWDNSVGTQIIRLTTTGLYDNYISNSNTNFQETWDFAFNCSTNEVLALGGGTNTAINMGVVNTSTGAVSISNITGNNVSTHQDIVNGTYDPNGNLYVLIASVTDPTIHNHIYRVNTSYNGNLWSVPDGFNSFIEWTNKPYWGFSNGYNALAADSNYLYYYDGVNLQALSLSTGAAVGSSYSLIGYTVLNQGGIAVDNCGHIYIGSQGVLKTFTFNGSTFTPGADISLGASFLSNAVHDIKYLKSSNLLFVTGTGMAGTFPASLSTACSIVGSFAVSVDSSCTSAVVTASAPSASSEFNFIWTDSLGNIIRQVTNTTNTTDSISGVPAGVYTIQLQLNLNCGGGGATFIKSVHVGFSSTTLQTNYYGGLNHRDTSMCARQSITISSVPTSSGGTFSWAPGGATTDSITVSPTVNTTYHVNYSYLGCLITDTVLVRVTPNPTVSIGNHTICPGDSVALIATPNIAGGTYNWNPGGSTQASIMVTPLTTSSYSVTYSLNGCSTIGSDTVTVKQSPNLSVTNVSICTGQSAHLTVTPSIGGGTYSWNPGGATTDTITVTPATTSVYTVSYTLNGCTKTVYDTVTVKPVPTLSIDNDTICAGRSATLLATPNLLGGTYSWSPGGATIDSITVTPATTSTYTVTYSKSGCSVTTTDTVKVNPVPILSVDNDTICAGLSATLLATPSILGGTYLWSPGGATIDSITVTPATTSTYTVTYSKNGCSVTTTDTVTVNPVLTLSADNDTICAGRSTTLLATPNLLGGTYSWSPGGATIDSITVTPATTSTYTVTYSKSGCSVTTTDTVMVNPAPTLSIDNDIICAGRSTTLIATPNTVGGTYSWNPVGATIDSITVTPVTTSTYTVTYSINGCSVTATDTVTVNSTLTLSVDNDTICAGQSTTLLATPNILGGTYSWNPSGAITDTITVTPVTSTNFTVTYSVNGCSVTSTDTVTVNPIPTLSVDNDTICSGQSTTLLVTPNILGGIYFWNPGGATTDTFTVHPTTLSNYTVTYSINGCSVTATDTVTVNSTLTLSVDNDTICLGQSTTLVATPNIFGGTYSWNPTGATTDTITVSPVANTNYTVTYSVNGCSVTSTDTIKVNSVPILSVDNDTICFGQSTTLLATPNIFGGTYSWNPSGATTDTITVTPVTSTNFTVTYSVNGCSVTSTDTVTVNPIPTLSIDNDTICFGQNSTLLATPNLLGGTYSWSPGGATIDSIIVTPATTSSYSVTYSLNGCSVTSTDTVTVNPIPTLSVDNDTICTGQSTTLLAIPNILGGTYSWNPGGATTDTITVTPATTSTYSVTYTLSGCSVTSTDTVKVNPIPTLSTDNDTICSGQNTTLLATPNLLGGTYSWNLGGAATDTITVTPATTSVYSVTYTLAGCSVTSTDTVKVNLVPTLTIDNDSICTGFSATLLATPNLLGGTYLWSPGGATTDTITVSPATTSTYSVTYTLAGCSVTSTDTVTVKPVPSLAVNNDSICIGQNAVLLAATNLGGGTYLWSPGGASTNSITVSPGANANYTVTYTVNGCSMTATDTVLVNLPPTVSGVVTNAKCAHDTSGNIVLTVTGNHPTFTYSWSNNATDSVNTGLTNSTYYVTVIDAKNCSRLDTFIVTAPPAITVVPAIIQVNCASDSTGAISLTVSGGVSPYTFVWNTGAASQNLTNLFAGTYSVTVADSNQCKDTVPNLIVTQPSAIQLAISSTPLSCLVNQDGTATVIANGGSPNYTYLWSNSATVAIASNLNVGQYFVTVTDTHHCTDTASVIVTVLPPVTFVSQLLNPLCPPLANGFIAVTASGGTPGYFYNWSNQTTDSSITNLSPGAYSLTVADSKGCDTIAQFNLQYSTPLSVSAATAATIKLGQSAVLQANTNINNGNHYRWVPTVSLSCDSCPEVGVTPTETTQYTIYVSDTNGCKASDTVTVTVIKNYDLFFPNAFSPNNDGNNDQYQIFGKLEAIKQFEISIYNRLGEKVFESTDAHFAWDGTYKGVLQTPGVFVYSANIVFIDEHFENGFKGSITLVR